MTKFKITLLSIIGIVGIIVLAFLLELGGLKWSKFFSPRKEAVRREVFKQTRSYNEGKIQQLAKYRHEYLSTTDESKRMAISSTIRHMFADYNLKETPTELKSFLKEIRGY